MRLFLAQRARLHDYPALQKRIDPWVRGRWRTPDSLHATALFLGNGYDVADVIETVASLGPLPLSGADLRGIGRFPRNRILYAAAEHPSLAQIHAALARVFGRTVQHPFVTHVTLMRYKQIDAAAFETLRNTLDNDVLGTLEGPLTLFRSVLGPQGARYEALHVFDTSAHRLHVGDAFDDARA